MTPKLKGIWTGELSDQRKGRLHQSRVENNHSWKRTLLMELDPRDTRLSSKCKSESCGPARGGAFGRSNGSHRGRERIRPAPLRGTRQSAGTRKRRVGAGELVCRATQIAAG